MHHARFSAGVVATSVALALLLPANASAHVPYLASGQRTDHIGTAAVPYPQAETIPPPNVSRAVYGYLSPEAAYDAYTFTVPATTTIEIGLIVPDRVGLDTFRPSLRLYAENSGVDLGAVDAGTVPRPAFWEPFSAARFWQGPTISAYLTPDERYYVLVYPPMTGKRNGAYVLTFSGPERFTTADWLRTASELPVIWLGSWAGGPARPGVYVCCVALVLLLAVVVWLALRRRRRRRTAERPASESGNEPTQSDVTSRDNAPDDAVG